VIVAYYGWAVFRSGDVFQPHAANAANREALVRIYSRISVGAPHEVVLQEYWSNRTSDLRLRADSSERWAVSMPSEFGASDWLLIVEFSAGKVRAVRVRTSDGPRPREAPPDKGQG
jgi:hypothetical protein